MFFWELGGHREAKPHSELQKSPLLELQTYQRSPPARASNVSGLFRPFLPPPLSTIMDSPPVGIDVGIEHLEEILAEVRIPNSVDSDI